MSRNKKISSALAYDPQQTVIPDRYCISLVFFSFQNNSKNLDLSPKMDLDF